MQLRMRRTLCHRCGLALLLSMLLTGCFAPVVEGVRQGADAVKRSTLQPKAEAGEAEAQYQLGMSYCCETGLAVQQSASVYDNQKATEWLCKAARQNHGPAQYELALIYSGEQSSGVGLIAKAKGLLTERPLALPVAATWAALATLNNVPKAAALKDSILRQLGPAEMAGQAQALSDWRNHPCLWNEVVGKQLSTGPMPQ